MENGVMFEHSIGLWKNETKNKLYDYTTCIKFS